MTALNEGGMFVKESERGEGPCIAERVSSEVAVVYMTRGM